jgi:hypothetical protein
MATPDHKARVRSSYRQDDSLTTIPDSSHHANLSVRPRHNERSAPMARLVAARLGRRRPRRDFACSGQADRQRRTDHRGPIHGGGRTGLRVLRLTLSECSA